MNGNEKIKKVFVIFKTHLDVGFTQYAKNVVDNYLEKYIPNAIEVGYELKDSQTPFVWTLGSWLVNLALKKGNKKLEQAIEDGIISWHGLPFTTHTELMSEKLFEYGLSIAKNLDKKFKTTTYSAKMTDVPGHTMGMIPHLENAGIKFLHLGVNPAAPVPKLPAIFRWKCGNSSVIVMYQGDYGEDAVFDDTAVVFAHTGDNCGPQSAESVVKVYEKLREKYPNAVEFKAATMNDFADIVIKNAENIPVVEKEIGDTWIHGTGCDPKKVSMYRELLRYIDENPICDADLTENLLLVPEHTWGVNMSKYYKFDDGYEYEDILKREKEKEYVEGSWDEQRAYVYEAEKALNKKIEYVVEKPDLSDYEKTDIYDTDFEISWQLFDNSDFERLKKVYLRLLVEWSIWDNTRVGLPDYKGDIYTAKIYEAYKKEEDYIYFLRFEDEERVKRFGLPEFVVEKNGEKMVVKWFGKKKSRFPQALWLKFKGHKEEWKLNKLGRWINPEDVVDGKLLSAVYEGVKNEAVKIESLDAHLVAPFGRHLLDYNRKEEKQDLYFNLYSNLFCTNFVMWYDDDARFRFNIKKLN